MVQERDRETTQLLWNNRNSEAITMMEQRCHLTVQQQGQFLAYMCDFMCLVNFFWSGISCAHASHQKKTELSSTRCFSTKWFLSLPFFSYGVLHISHSCKSFRMKVCFVPRLRFDIVAFNSTKESWTGTWGLTTGLNRFLYFSGSTYSAVRALFTKETILKAFITTKTGIHTYSSTKLSYCRFWRAVWPSSCSIFL